MNPVPAPQGDRYSVNPDEALGLFRDAIVAAIAVEVRPPNEKPLRGADVIAEAAQELAEAYQAELKKRLKVKIEDDLISKDAFEYCANDATEELEHRLTKMLREKLGKPGNDYEYEGDVTTIDSVCDRVMGLTLESEKLCMLVLARQAMTEAIDARTKALLDKTADAMLSMAG